MNHKKKAREVNRFYVQSPFKHFGRAHKIVHRKTNKGPKL